MQNFKEWLLTEGKKDLRELEELLRAAEFELVSSSGKENKYRKKDTKDPEDKNYTEVVVNKNSLKNTTASQMLNTIKKQWRANVERNKLLRAKRLNDNNE